MPLTYGDKWYGSPNILRAPMFRVRTPRRGEIHFVQSHPIDIERWEHLGYKRWKGKFNKNWFYLYCDEEKVLRLAREGRVLLYCDKEMSSAAGWIGWPGPGPSGSGVDDPIEDKDIFPLLYDSHTLS